MDTTSGVGSESLASIREQIEQTRASLGRKLESLETEVRSGAVEASHSVRERIDRIKRAFDLDYHVKQHPWRSVSLAFGVGFVLSQVRFGPRDLGGPDTQEASTIEKEPADGWLQRALRTEGPRLRALSYDIGSAILKDVFRRSLLARLSPGRSAATYENSPDI
jgi:ElaB/YqjD/DUF883 family membrane-anchored ribosome-binding protein